VRQLLTHTSAIPEYEDEVDWRRDYSERQLAELVGLLRRRSTPGQKFEYSNSGYLLLGIIIRMITGKFHADYVRENIFEPLGMKTARIVSDADIVPNRVAGYRMSKDRILNQDWVSPTFNQTADGCVRLSLNDLLAWERGVRARALLKPESWSQILRRSSSRAARRIPTDLHGRSDRKVARRYTATMVRFRVSKRS